MTSKLWAAHTSLIEAVNTARTEAEHELALTRLQGFRQALDCLDPRPLYVIECDNYYLSQGIHRPMVAGVFLDWRPA